MCFTLKQELRTLANRFFSISRALDDRNGILNDPVCLVIPSAYGSGYMTVDDYKTENKTHVDSECE